MSVVRTLMKPKRYHQVSLRAAFVLIASLVLLVLVMAITASVSVSANQPAPSSQSPGKAQVRISAAVNAVVNLGNSTPISGVGQPYSNGKIPMT